MKFSKKLGLGTVQFGFPYGISNKAGQTTSEEVSKILDTAKAYKVEVLDSARAYGDSENVLGQNDLSSFKMISKYMPPKKESISIQLENSLKILGIKSLYGYLAHRPVEILKDPGQWEKLQNFKEQAKVQKIGFSLNEPEELAQLLDKNFFPDLVQVPFNYFDRRFETAVKELKNKGCEIHTRSTFLQGLFFMDPTKLDVFFNEVKPLITRLHAEKPLNGALLKFVLEKSYIDKVIIGVENESQLVQNIESLEIASSLPDLEHTISENLLSPTQWPK